MSFAMKARTFAAICLVFGIAVPVHATLINFEELPNGLVAMPNAAIVVPAQSRLTNQYLASSGVSFTSLAGFAGLVDHGAGFPTASDPNIIGGTDANGVLDYTRPITISFFDVGNPSLKAVTDTFKIQGDWYPFGPGFGSVFATAYDPSGNVLGSTSDTDDKPFGVSGPVLQFNIPGIHSVVISGDQGSVGFDQLEFGTLTTVPEPGSLLLLAVGLGLLGCWSRQFSRPSC
jgi:hypothetical protein